MGDPMMRDEDASLRSAAFAGLTGRCPRCGRGRMFSGFLALAQRCERCGLDLSFADAGDGPAVLVSLAGGFIVLSLALITEILYEPPFWIHLAVFLPLTALVCLGLARPLKGLLIALQYRTNSAEGRLEG
jgi:uncharacterized protein (DUF983 family)